MALSTNDVQTTCSQHFIMYDLPIGFQIGNFLRFLNFTQVFIVMNDFKGILKIATQHNVGTTTCHIGGHGNHAWLTRLRHNIGFALMLFGIQDIVFQALLIQQMRHQLWGFNAGGTH